MTGAISYGDHTEFKNFRNRQAPTLLEWKGKAQNLCPYENKTV